MDGLLCQLAGWGLSFQLGEAAHGVLADHLASGSLVLGVSGGALLYLGHLLSLDVGAYFEFDGLGGPAYVAVKGDGLCGFEL